ncbi:hypothetical protein [Streptacidiphilus sp. PAMC 29251]
MMIATVRHCSYCPDPTAGTLVRLDPDDRTSPLVALDHPACYRQHIRLLRAIQAAADAILATLP